MGLTSADTVQIVAYSDTTTVLNNLQTDRSALRSLVQNLRPSHRKTNHLGALKLAQQLLASAPNDRLEIHWISDFQQTGWAESAEETTLIEGVTIQPFDVAEDRGGNLSVNQLRLSHVVENDTPQTRASVQVISSGMSAPTSARVVLELNGKRVQDKELALERTIRSWLSSMPSTFLRDFPRERSGWSLPTVWLPITSITLR